MRLLIYLPLELALLWLAPIAPGDKVQIMGGQEDNSIIWDGCPPLLWEAKIAQVIRGKQARKLQATLEGCKPKLSPTDSLTDRSKV